MNLGQTLSFLTLLVLIAFCLATSTMTQLDLSSHVSERSQSDGLARAAVNEFILRVNLLPQPPVTSTPPPVLNNFLGSSAVLFTPSATLQGTATILASESIDNLANPAAVPGNFQNTVPPYSLSLVYRIDNGRRSYVYESVLQQRWPYALAGVGPIAVVGAISDLPAIPGAGDPHVPSYYQSNPSRIEGRILGMKGEAWTDDPNDLRTETTSSDGGTQDTAVSYPISYDFFNRLSPFAGIGSDGASPSAVPGSSDFPPPAPANLLKVGGIVRLFTLGIGSDSSTNLPIPIWTPYDTETVNATIVKGNLDIWDNTSPDMSGVTNVGGTSSNTVAVDPASTMDGTNRTYGPAPLAGPYGLTRASMIKILTKPDTSSWASINGAIGGAPVNVTAANLTTLTIDGAMGRGGQADITGNVSVQSLNLSNVELSIEGDLQVEGQLIGSSSTLVVNGTLCLESGTLDSGGGGLVIYCRTFICHASGIFHGLIISQRSAAIYGGNVSASIGNTSVPVGNTSVSAPTLLPTVGTLNTLNIDGGLLVGGTNLRVTNPELNSTLATDCHLTTQTLGLIATNITYNPQYLRGLNAAGQFTLLTTELRR